MAGTTTKSQATNRPGSDARDVVVEFNKLVTDVETLRSAAGTQSFSVDVENLAAGADLTERAHWRAPVALTILSAHVIWQGASVGVDGANTALVSLRNLTAAEDVATFTFTTNRTANTADALTLQPANVDVAAGAVLGLVVTQGTTADLSAFTIQGTYHAQALDAAGDLLAGKIGDFAGTPITGTNA